MGRRPSAPRVWQDEEHGDVFQFSFTALGKRHRGSTGCRDRAAAEEEVGRLYAAALAGKRPPRSARSLKRPSAQEDLIDLFAAFLVSLQGKKSDSYVGKMKSHFWAHFAHRWRTVSEMVEPGALDAYATDRLAGKAPAHEIKPRRPRPAKGSSVTVHKELVTLRRFLAWARKMGYIAEVPHVEPVAQVSDYTPPDYTPDQARALLAALPDRHHHRTGHPVREFFTVQWAEASRPGEIESLRTRDVNLKLKQMTIRQSEDKARVGRAVGLSKEAHKVLADMLKEERLPDALLFGARDYRTQLEKAAKALELPRPTRHNLRHFRLTELGHTPRASLPRRCSSWPATSTCRPPTSTSAAARRRPRSCSRRLRNFDTVPRRKRKPLDGRKCRILPRSGLTPVGEREGAEDLKSPGRKAVRVRVPSRVPTRNSENRRISSDMRIAPRHNKPRQKGALVEPKTCAVCRSTGALTLTRQGLRCGPCLRGENEIMRQMLRALASAHQGEPGPLGDMARQAISMLGEPAAGE